MNGSWRPRGPGGETVLITAGPTQEPLDPVRYISNRSSGKMGYALAEAAAARGARVMLVSGPVHLRAAVGVNVVPVHTANEMREAVMAHLQEATIIIKAAAVADYHVADVPTQKVKKTAMRLSLELDPTPDILAEVGRQKKRPAADRLRRRDARIWWTRHGASSQSKNCDMVVANLVEPGRNRLRVGRERSGAGAAHRRDDSAAARAQARRSPTRSSTTP